MLSGLGTGVCVIEIECRGQRCDHRELQVPVSQVGGQS